MKTQGPDEITLQFDVLGNVLVCFFFFFVGLFDEKINPPFNYL